MSEQTKRVDVLARQVFEEYSRAGGNHPDSHFDRNAAEQWMAHALQVSGVAALIEASRRTIRAFEALGNSSGVVQTLEAHRECEAAMVAQKEALAGIGGAK